MIATCKNKEANAPDRFRKLVRYITDSRDLGEKVAWLRITNCQSQDVEQAIREVAATQARNTRSKVAKTYHLVASFPDGERPDRQQIEDIEERLCEALGFGTHQRISAAHQNTSNWHLHVAINKVRPDNFRNVTPFWDHFRLQKACAELEQKHSLTPASHTRSLQERAQNRDKETSRFGESKFRVWVQTNALPVLLQAVKQGQTWQNIHGIAASFSLVIKRQKRGLLVQSTANGRNRARASDIAPELGFRPMTAVLGPYEPPNTRARTESNPELYKLFKQDRGEAVQARVRALEELHHRHLEYAQRLDQWFRDRLRREQMLDLPGVLKHRNLQHVREQYGKAKDERIAREASERKAVRESWPVPTWPEWLENRARLGCEQSLEALRSFNARAAKLEHQILTAPNAEAARHIVRQHMSPAVERNGRVFYRLADGGMVSDEAGHVRVDQPSVAAHALALELAADRFAGQPLIVRGDDGFRRQVAELAGLHKMGVEFADRELERIRSGAAINRVQEREAGIER